MKAIDVMGGIKCAILQVLGMMVSSLLLLFILSHEAIAFEDSRSVCESSNTPINSVAYSDAVKQWNNRFYFKSWGTEFPSSGRENFQPWILDAAPCFWLSPYSPYRSLPANYWVHGIPIPLKNALNKQIIHVADKMHEFFNLGETSSESDTSPIQVEVTAIKHHKAIFLEVNNNGSRVLWLKGNRFLWSFRNDVSVDSLTDTRLSDLDGDGNLELSAWNLQIEFLTDLKKSHEEIFKMQKNKEKEVCNALEFLPSIQQYALEYEHQGRNVRYALDSKDIRQCDYVYTNFHVPDFQLYSIDKMGMPKPVRYGKWARWYKEETLRIYPEIEKALYSEISQYDQQPLDSVGHAHMLSLQVRKLFFVLEGTGDAAFISEIYAALNQRFGNKLWGYVDSKQLANGMAMYGYNYLQKLTY